jgi:hypothetical protein
MRLINERIASEMGENESSKLFITKRELHEKKKDVYYKSKARAKESI